MVKKRRFHIDSGRSWTSDPGDRISAYAEEDTTHAVGNYATMRGRSSLSLSEIIPSIRLEPFQPCRADDTRDWVTGYELSDLNGAAMLLRDLHNEGFEGILEVVADGNVAPFLADDARSLTAMWNERNLAIPVRTTIREFERSFDRVDYLYKGDMPNLADTVIQWAKKLKRTDRSVAPK